MTTNQGIGIVQYAHAALAVTDVERALKFWNGVLGLEQIERPELDLPGAWLQVGDSQLHLIGLTEEEFPRPMPNTRVVGHVSLLVPGKEAYDDALEAITTRGAEPGKLIRSGVREDVVGVPIWNTILNDPDGNFVEVTTQESGRQTAKLL